MGCQLVRVWDRWDSGQRSETWQVCFKLVFSIYQTYLCESNIYLYHVVRMDTWKACNSVTEKKKKEKRNEWGREPGWLSAGVLPHFNVWMHKEDHLEFNMAATCTKRGLKIQSQQQQLCWNFQFAVTMTKLVGGCHAVGSSSDAMPIILFLSILIEVLIGIHVGNRYLILYLTNFRTYLISRIYLGAGFCKY